MGDHPDADCVHQDGAILSLEMTTTEDRPATFKPHLDGLLTAFETRAMDDFFCVSGFWLDVLKRRDYRSQLKRLTAEDEHVCGRCKKSDEVTNFRPSEGGYLSNALV